MGGQPGPYLLLLLAATAILHPVVVVGAQSVSSSSTCTPRLLVLQLSPGVDAADVYAVLVDEEGYTVLPSRPLGASIEGLVLYGYEYNGRPLYELDLWELAQLVEILRALPPSKALEILRPVVVEKEWPVIGHGREKVLVVLPCKRAPLLAGASSVVDELESKALAAYEADGLRILLVPKNAVLEKAGPPPFTPPARGRVLAAVYQAGDRGEPLLLEALYNYTPGAPMSVAVVKPTGNNVSHGAAESVTGWLWQSLAWEGASITPYNTSLGALTGARGVVMKGWHWSASDALRVPPATARYEVWLVIGSNTTTTARLRIWLNNVLVVDSTVSLAPEWDNVVGVIVHAVPEEPGNYLEEWARVEYRVSLEALDAPLEAMVKAVAVARSWVGPATPDNGVYEWVHSISGVDTVGRDTEYYPPLRVPSERLGSYTLVLEAPSSFLEGSGALQLTLYGPAHAQPAGIAVLLNDYVACNGTSSPDAGGLQVFQCSVEGGMVSEAVLDSLRLGEPLVLQIDINNTVDWFLEGGQLLKVLRRMHAAPVDLAIMPLWVALASLDINNAKLYSRVLMHWGSALIYALGAVEFETSGVGAATVLYYPVPVAHVAAALYASRPLKGLTNDIGAGTIVFSVVLNPIVLSPAGVLASKVHDIRGKMMLTGSALVRVWPAAAKILGEGPVGYGETGKYLSVLSFLLGVASIVVSGGLSTVFGVFSVIASIPAFFFQQEPLTAVEADEDYSIGAYTRWLAPPIAYVDKIGLLLYTGEAAPAGGEWRQWGLLASVRVDYRLMTSITGASYGYTGIVLEAPSLPVPTISIKSVS